MAERRGYNNIAIPADLVARIDLLVQHSNLGYRSRGEFVKEAVRNLLKDLRKFD